MLPSPVGVLISVLSYGGILIGIEKLPEVNASTSPFWVILHPWTLVLTASLVGFYSGGVIAIIGWGNSTVIYSFMMFFLLVLTLSASTVREYVITVAEKIRLTPTE